MIMLNLVTLLQGVELGIIITSIALKNIQKCVQFMELNKGQALIFSNIP